MGVLQFIKKHLIPFNKQTTSVTSTEIYANNHPHLLDNQKLSASDIINLSYITRSIQMIAQDVAKIDFDHVVYDKKTNQKTNKISKLFWILNRKPNDEMRAYDFWKTIVWNLFIYEKAVIYLSYEKNKAKVVRNLIEIIPIPPNTIKRIKDVNNNKVYYELSDYEGERGNVVRIQKENIIWIDFEYIQNIANVSFLALFKSTIAKLRENESAIYNAIRNDLGMAMVITVPDITDKDAVNHVQNTVNDMIRRQKRTGSVAMVKDRRWEIDKQPNIIESKIDYQTRNAIAREIASMFGIPAAKLGIEDQNKYNSMVERNRAYADDALKPILDRITKALTDGFFETNIYEEISYKPIALLSMDPISMKEFSSNAINNGYMTPNEVRELFGLSRLENGDDLMVNSATLPIKTIVSKVEAETNKILQETKYFEDLSKNNEGENDGNNNNTLDTNSDDNSGVHDVSFNSGILFKPRANVRAKKNKK